MVCTYTNNNYELIDLVIKEASYVCSNVISMDDLAG